MFVFESIFSILLKCRVYSVSLQAIRIKTEITARSNSRFSEPRHRSSPLMRNLLRLALRQNATVLTSSELLPWSISQICWSPYFSDNQGSRPQKVRPCLTESPLLTKPLISPGCFLIKLVDQGIFPAPAFRVMRI